MNAPRVDKNNPWFVVRRGTGYAEACQGDGALIDTDYSPPTGMCPYQL